MSPSAASVSPSAAMALIGPRDLLHTPLGGYRDGRVASMPAPVSSTAAGAITRTNPYAPASVHLLARRVAELELLFRTLTNTGTAELPTGDSRVRLKQTRDNPSGLTPRELEVLALVAEGLRNAEIAARLVVSAKTVDHHVCAILRKLDARTRGEASAEARRQGIV